MSDFYYILVWSKGKSWSSPDDPGFLAHIEYMRKLNKERKLILGGPFEDGSGSITIFNCPEEEINFIIKNDPGLLSGILEVSVKKMSLFYK